MSRYHLPRSLLLAFPVLTLAAPPLNDHFSNAHNLGSATPATHFTSNTDATLEPGEPDPTGNGGASVWYRWTATASGWHTVSTLASGYDTVLYIFTGNTLGELQLVSRSDDASPSELQSLARFQTVAGTTYHIAVHGFGGETGDLFFDIDTSPTPLHVTSVSIANPPADLAAEDASTTLHVGVASPDGFSDGSVGLSTPVGGIPAIAFTRFDSADRIAGDHLAGTYAVSVPLPRYGPPGGWPIDLRLAATTADTARYGHPTAGDIFPTDITTTHVAATNTGNADTTAPTLAHVSFSPATVDVTSSPKTVTLTLEIDDALSGTETTIIDLIDPLGDFYDRLLVSTSSLTSGDPNSGTFTLDFHLPQFIPAGTYTIDDFLPLDIIDRTGNRRSYGAFDTPYPTGSTTAFTVVNNAGTDTSPPVVTAADLAPGTADVGPAPASLTATFTATDDLAGITSGTVGLELPTGERVSAPFDDLDRIAGSPTSGTYRVPLTLTAGDVTPGTYPLVLVLHDAVGYSSQYGGTFGERLPPGGNHAVTVTDSGPGPSPYELWIAGYPTLTGPAATPLADPDHDGLANLAELPFGLDPTLDSSPGGPDPNHTNAPTLTKSPTTISLTYTLVPANLTAYNHPPVTVTPQSTPDLKTNTPLTPENLGANRYRATTGTTSTPTGHLTLKITTPPP